MMDFYARHQIDFLRSDSPLSNDFFYSGYYRDKWFWYPAPFKNEPEKAVSWLTDTGDNSYAGFHLSKLMLRASLFGIDRFFMQVRRRISLLERSMSSSSAMGRRWYGYSPYNPEHAVKLLKYLEYFTTISMQPLTPKEGFSKKVKYRGVPVKCLITISLQLCALGSWTNR